MRRRLNSRPGSLSRIYLESAWTASLTYGDAQNEVIINLYFRYENNSDEYAIITVTKDLDDSIKDVIRDLGDGVINDV